MMEFLVKVHTVVVGIIFIPIMLAVWMLTVGYVFMPLVQAGMVLAGFIIFGPIFALLKAIEYLWKLIVG